MAGVLFIICIPRENFEFCLRNRVVNALENKDNDPDKTLRNQECSSNESLNGTESSKASKHSLNTCAVSIESDSLDQNIRDKDNRATESKVKFGRTRSLDDERIDDKIASEQQRREQQGSMDSDLFRRTMERKVRMQENEEAVAKFFETNVERPLLDKTTTSMERVLLEIIDRMRIRNASWQRINGGNSFKISFSLEKGVRCDDTIHMLSEFGIGQKAGSSIAVIPCTLYSDKSRFKDDDDASTSTQAIFKETAWNRFIGTVRARLNVAKTVEIVKSDASVTFDFIILLVVASVVAGIGLIENSTLFLAASMLISPLMGPILAATFGTVIKDYKLQFWGLRNEIFGILMCIIVGFLMGIGVCLSNYTFEEAGLTSEMMARCRLHSVYVGIFIALPSGAAVAIAILGENFGSLVGVAISASLLPPAVNTGLLWSFSCMDSIIKTFSLDYFPKFESFIGHNSTSLEKYTEDDTTNLLIYGSISLLVTLTNVLCVYLMGFLILYIKIELAPVLSDEERQFWKHDVPIARDYNKSVNAEDGKKMQEELAKFCKNESENFRGIGAELLRQDFYVHTNTWSPLTNIYNRKDAATRTSLRDIENLYQTLSGRQMKPQGSFETRSLFCPKSSDPIATPMPSTSRDQFKICSAPLDVINEQISRQTTFVTIESSNSNDESTPENGNRKFVVTPAHDSFI